MRHLTRMAALSGCAIFSVAGLASAPAYAQQTVRGQGATLPAGLYADWFNPTISPNITYTYNAPLRRSNGSTIAATTGSGAGKAAFESHTFNNNSYVPVVGQPAQPLPSDVTTAQKEDIQFAGSDAILTAADLDTYQTQRWGNPIQVPSVGTPVTLAFNQASLRMFRSGPTGLANPSTGVQPVAKILFLSRASYCGIFTGQIANWNHPRIVADNGAAPSKLPIKVVVRSDSSGTTEIFSRHLDTVCDGSTAAGGYTFPSTNTANPSVPTGRTTISWSTLIPSNRLISATGSGGVSTAIANNSEAIGYVSPDFTNIVATPAAGAGSPAPATANLQNQNDITTGVAKYSHSPAFPNVKAAQGGIAAPLQSDSAITWGEKLALTDPRSNNPVNANAYPIVGFTFLDFYTCYPKNRLNAVKAFATFFTNNKTTAGSANAEAQAAGFAPLTSSMRTAVRNRLLTSGGPVQGPIAGTCSL